MEVINNRLATILERLKQTELVVNKQVNYATIDEFAKILNKSAPVTEQDNAIGEFVRFIYKKNRSSFFKYIHITDLTHLVLLTDGMPIVSILGLRGLVSIYWNK
jgi:hypothetical protein